MKKILILISCVAALIIFIYGCRKDVVSTGNTPANYYKSNIYGVVLDENNEPILNATVTFGQNTRLTDKNGIYSFLNVEVRSTINYIKISGAGYFDTGRSFNTQKKTTIKLKNILLKKDFSNSFNSTIESKINKGEVTLKFPANSIVDEASGNSYTGQVMVALKYLNPSMNATFVQMPGSLTGVSVNNDIHALYSLGMIAVELQSTSGQKLQVKSGEEVEISMDLPQNWFYKAPQTIPLWYFDEGLGMWKEEGKATLEQHKYVGKVKHFSWWNFDGSSPGVNGSGRVIDQAGNPLSDAYVTFKPSTGDTAYAGYACVTTDANGNFSGMIPKNLVLDVTIRYINTCGEVFLYTSQVGPFNDDVVLPDIIVQVSQIKNLWTISGNFVDCNNQPVQNGYAFFNYLDKSPYYIPIENGYGTATFNMCYSPPFQVTITALDLGTILESSPISVNGDNVTDLGTVQICGNEPDYFKMQNAELGINSIVRDTFQLKYTNYQKNLRSSLFGVQGSLYFSWEDGLDHAIEAGTFPIQNASFYFGDNPDVRYFSLISGTVNITSGGMPGSTARGTFSVTVQNTETVDEYNITGEFKKLIP